jgi:hypothetical protein
MSSQKWYNRTVVNGGGVGVIGIAVEAVGSMQAVLILRSSFLSDAVADGFRREDDDRHAADELRKENIEVAYDGTSY